MDDETSCYLFVTAYIRNMTYYQYHLLITHCVLLLLAV